MSSQTTSKKHPCSYDNCQYSTNYPSKLKRHVDGVHLDFRPHQCSECASSFSQKANLTTHINLVHRQIRPFKCTICTKAFGHRADLRKHRESVHDGVRFACRHCNKRYRSLGTLSQHLRTVHQYDSDEEASGDSVRPSRARDASRRRVARPPRRQSTIVTLPAEALLAAVASFSSSHSDSVGASHSNDSHGLSSTRDSASPLAATPPTTLRAPPPPIVLRCPDCPYTSLEQGDLNIHLVLQHPI
jgi:hypothetical protein